MPAAEKTGPPALSLTRRERRQNGQRRSMSSTNSNNPVFFVVNIYIPDPNDRQDYDKYIQKVKPVVEKAGGRYLVRSEKISAMFGSQKPDRVIIIEFENLPQLEACFASPDYKAIKQLREKSVTAHAFIVE